MGSSLVVFFFVFCVTLVIPLYKIPNPGNWPSAPFLALNNVIRLAISVLASLILALPISRTLLPLLFYVPQTTAMKELGLYAVSADPTEGARLMFKCANDHLRCGPKENVKVICISGRYLFREPGLPDSTSLPLHELGLKGKLDVIMPRSDVANPTIQARYKTYNHEFRETHGINTIDRFVNFEIDAGKKFLKEHGNNLTEHHILCMWRVVIFHNFCLVQNYFPNYEGYDSFRAPLLVFRRTGAVKGNSYYETYSSMFDLIKQVSTSS